MEPRIGQSMMTSTSRRKTALRCPKTSQGLCNMNWPKRLWSPVWDSLSASCSNDGIKVWYDLHILWHRLWSATTRMQTTTEACHDLGPGTSLFVGPHLLGTRPSEMIDGILGNTWKYHEIPNDWHLVNWDKLRLSWRDLQYVPWNFCC